jgi:hypothetical protein
MLFVVFVASWLTLWVSASCGADQANSLCETPAKKLRESRSRRYIYLQRFLYKGLGSPNSAEGVIPPARAVQ